MGQPIIQPSFAAGELSPSLYGRVDLAKYHVGAALLRNFFVDYRGGASNRPGTRFVGECLPFGRNRLIPFTFSTLQTYMLVFSDLQMRVIMDGAFVLEEPHAISNINRNAACTLFTAFDPQPWGVFDWIYVTGVQGMTQVNGRFFQLRGAFAITALLGDLSVADNPIDSTAFNAWTAGGTAARVYTIATPWAAADLPLLKFTQSADVMTICHPDYPTYQLTRTGHTAWTLTQVTFVPSIPTPNALAAVPSDVGDGTSYSYVVTALAQNGVTESLPSNVVTAANSKTMTATASAHQTVTWDAVPNSPLYNVYRQAEVPGGAAAAGQLFGFVGTTTGTAFVDANIGPDFSRTPPQPDSTPGTVGHYPGCTTYFEQRQVFAGANAEPQTMRFSKTADFLNMGYSSPARPDDAIVATINALQVNAIKHLVPMDSLIALTGHGAWKVDGGSDGSPVTPSSIAARPQAYNGCSDVPPITINQDLLYVQAKGSAVRDLAYNLYVKVYTGTDISVLSNHLFRNHRIVEWAWAEEPSKLIYAVREDGVMLFLTYLKEQDVYAWAHADTDGQFFSVASIVEGNEDAVYVIVNRLKDGVYWQYVERFASRELGAEPEKEVPDTVDQLHGVPADFTRFWFVDSGLATPLTYPAATLTPGAVWSDPTLYDVEVVVGGAGYVLPVATIEDPTGAGAVITLTVAGGVITDATVTPGLNYTDPVITVVDTGGNGAGAVLAGLTSRDVEMRTDNPVLAGVVVDSLVVVNGGFGRVRHVDSARAMIVTMYGALGQIFPAVAGAWSCTAPRSSVGGLWHLEGKTVSVLGDGSVQDRKVVENGTVTLDNEACAIVVGLPYVAQLRSLYTDIPAEPTVQGKRKSIPAVTVRQQDSRGLKIASQGEPLVEFKERTTEPMGVPVAAYTGDRRVQIFTKMDVPGQILVQQDDPLPATVLALIPEVVIGDSA